MYSVFFVSVEMIFSGYLKAQIKEILKQNIFDNYKIYYSTYKYYTVINFHKKDIFDAFSIEYTGCKLPQFLDMVNINIIFF